MKDAGHLVYLVDDDTSFLVAMSRLLRASGFRVKSFTSATEFLSGFSDEMTGCVITDLQMPGMGGIELQASLARSNSSLAVIFLTGQGDIPSTVHAMRSGAEDFIEKRASGEVILAAVRRALDQATDKQEARAKREQLRAKFQDLSARELEVLGQVVQGKLNKQIAADLGIAERTVKAHRTAVTTKLGVPSVAGLTQLVHEARLFDSASAYCPKGQ